MLHAFVDKVDGPKMQQWNDIILKYNPDETITGFSAVSMASGVAAVKALEAVGRDLTRSKFIAELEKISGLGDGHPGVRYHLDADRSPRLQEVRGGRIRRWNADGAVVLGQALVS